MLIPKTPEDRAFSASPVRCLLFRCKKQTWPASVIGCCSDSMTELTHCLSTLYFLVCESAGHNKALHVHRLARRINRGEAFSTESSLCHHGKGFGKTRPNWNSKQFLTVVPGICAAVDRMSQLFKELTGELASEDSEHRLGPVHQGSPESSRQGAAHAQL